jgi:O-acetylserine/cysteine efflux transporter
MWLARERVRTFQIAALGLAAVGLVVIVAHTDATVTPLGLGLVLFAAASWAGGNMASKAAGTVNMLSYVVWSSLFAVPPLVALSLIFEGPSAIVDGVRAADAATWAAVLWQSVGNSLFGYAAWGWLLARHPAATITPMAMLVPVFGMGASAIFLAEPLPAWKLAAAALVMSGLALNIFWPRLERRLSPA